MKLIYVSHPYGGDPVEAADADNRIKALAEKYPQFVFISPIHAIRRDYHATDWGGRHCGVYIAGSKM